MSKSRTKSASVFLCCIALLGVAPTLQAQSKLGPPTMVEDVDFDLALPPANRLFRAEPEAIALDRIRTALLRQKIKKVEFPANAPPEPSSEQTRAAEPRPLKTYLVPSVVYYQPLYFEVTRTERFAEYTPVIQPLLSARRFYVDTLLLPVKIVCTPPWLTTCDSFPE